MYCSGSDVVGPVFFPVDLVFSVVIHLLFWSLYPPPPLMAQLRVLVLTPPFSTPCFAPAVGAHSFDLADDFFPFSLYPPFFRKSLLGPSRPSPRLVLPVSQGGVRARSFLDGESYVCFLIRMNQHYQFIFPLFPLS